MWWWTGSGPSNHDIATGVGPYMTAHGWAGDKWPTLLPRVMRANILVIGGPIWPGDNSSAFAKLPLPGSSVALILLAQPSAWSSP